MPKAKHIVNQFFPNVKKVNDADKDLHIQVTDRDTKTSRVKDHNGCALAVACKRSESLDGVIVAVGTAYLIKGDIATRYRLPASVSREIVSFDRKGGFYAGEYNLKAPAKSHRLGAIKDHSNNNNGGPRLKKMKDQFRHRTEGVRAVLGSKVAPDGITRG